MNSPGAAWQPCGSMPGPSPRNREQALEQRRGCSLPSTSFAEQYGLSETPKERGPPRRSRAPSQATHWLLCSGGWIIPRSHPKPLQRQEEKPQPGDSLPRAWAVLGGCLQRSHALLICWARDVLLLLKHLFLGLFVPGLFSCFVSLHPPPPFNPISALLVALGFQRWRSCDPRLRGPPFAPCKALSDTFLRFISSGWSCPDFSEVLVLSPK